MTGYANTWIRFFKNHGYRIALCVCWLFGLLFGSQLCLGLEPSFLLMMRSAVLQPVSIVGLLVSVFLPLIFSYFSIFSNRPVILVIVCFLKAVAFGFTGALISQFFDSASWLLRFLFLFSDSCFSIVLFLLWFRRCSYAHIIGFADVYFCAAVGLCIVIVDYFIISPFLLGLF